MQCIDCSETYDKKLGSVMFKSVICGQVKTPKVKFFECRKCKRRLFDAASAEIINDAVLQREQEFIRSLPIGDFISLRQAAELLGMTPDRFRRNKRIARGFILSTVVARRRFYHFDSVWNFKKTGDGRKI
jgi:hypothetical protein